VITIYCTIKTFSFHVRQAAVNTLPEQIFSGKNVIKPYDQVHLSPEIKDEVHFVNPPPQNVMFSGKNVIKPYDQVHLSPEIKDEVNFVNSAPPQNLNLFKAHSLLSLSFYVPPLLEREAEAKKTKERLSKHQHALY
jgi:hypothetical protein